MNKSLLVLNLNGMIKCLLSSMGSLSIYLTFRELDWWWWCQSIREKPEKEDIFAEDHFVEFVWLWVNQVFFFHYVFVFQTISSVLRVKWCLLKVSFVERYSLLSNKCFSFLFWSQCLASVSFGVWGFLQESLMSKKIKWGCWKKLKCLSSCCWVVADSHHCFSSEQTLTLFSLSLQ